MFASDLKGKNVYIFSPSFFGYDSDIKNEVKNLGANVFLFDERVFTSLIGKALIRLNLRWLVQYVIDFFYTKKLLNKVMEVDYVLLINPETIPPRILLKAKEINPKVKVIIYMWDSFKNKPFAKKYIDFSDSFFTFDPNDAKENKVEFLPLFYANEYKDLAISNVLKYNFTFIGTAHSERFKIVNDIVKSGEKVFLFFYSPSKLVFLYKKYILGELDGLNLSDVSFSLMTRRDIVEVLQNTNAVIDISHQSQFGLTMRSIEMLGAKKKLITTNRDVLFYDFYHPNNILYFDSNTTLEDIKGFLKLPYFNISDDIYYDYSINSWIKKLFL